MSDGKTAGETRWEVLIPATPGHKDGLPELDLEGLESWAIRFIRRHASEERQMVLSDEGQVVETFPYYVRLCQGKDYLLTTWDTQFIVPTEAPAAVLDAHSVAQLAWLLRTDDPANPMSAEALSRFGFALGQAVATFRIRKTGSERLGDRLESTPTGSDVDTRAESSDEMQSRGNRSSENDIAGGDASG